MCAEHGVALISNIEGNEESFIWRLEELKVDLVFLTWWPSIMKERTIQSAKVGFVNLHPSLLPYGRGKHAYFYSIVDDEPFGVTIHLIDSGIDTGPILFQKK